MEETAILAAQGAFPRRILSGLIRWASTLVRRSGEAARHGRSMPVAELERLVDFLRAAADFVWEADEELRLVWLSDAAPTVLGRPIEEFLGRRWSELACASSVGPIDPAGPPAPLPGAPGFPIGRPFRDRRCCVVGRDGRLRTLELSGVPLFDRAGRAYGYRGIAREVSERARFEQRLRFLAAHDPLTGAANRVLLSAASARACERAAASGRRVGLVTVDLDGFKAINDAHGHATGDAVLRAVVGRLRSVARGEDLVARLGGDEFALLLVDLERPEELAARLVLVEARLAAPLVVAGRTLLPGASCGGALWPDDGDGLEDLLACADARMYRAKRARRGARVGAAAARDTASIDG